MLKYQHLVSKVAFTYPPVDVVLVIYQLLKRQGIYGMFKAGGKLGWLMYVVFIWFIAYILVAFSV